MSEPDYKKDLEEFAYIVSHDLNAPFRHIKQFGNILIKKLDEKVTDEEREYLQFMEGAVKKAEAMLAGLLDYSRLNTRAEPYTEFDCKKLVDVVIASLDGKISETDAKIICADLPETFIADKSQVRKLFFHLLDNALKFTQPGQSPEITIAAKSQDNSWLFSMQDNGMGIPADQHENIFTIFKRLNDDDKTPGVGAGLATAQKVVERHGGKIWVESEPEKGAVFYFTIPKNLVPGEGGVEQDA